MLTIFTTCPSESEARELAQKLVFERLAGCVQILPKVSSVYIWEGEIQNEPEHLLIIKTLPEKWNDVKAFIVRQHSYDVPEMIGLESDLVSEKYSEWLSSVVNRL